MLSIKPRRFEQIADFFKTIPIVDSSFPLVTDQFIITPDIALWLIPQKLFKRTMWILSMPHTVSLDWL